MSQAFKKPSGSPVHKETRGEVDVGEAGEGPGSSFSEMEGCDNEEPKIARSVTEGELRHRILSPLSQHGVSSEYIAAFIECYFGRCESCSTEFIYSANAQQSSHKHLH